jgi:cobalt-zinc-cadmium efflux system outer membrane protein
MSGVIVSVFLVLRAFLAAAGAGANPLSLEEVLSYALAHNPEVVRAQKELEAAGGRRLQQSAYPFPDLVFRDEGLSFRRDGLDREVSFGVEQLIEFPGKRSLRKEAAGYDRDAAAAELERVRSIVSADVKRAYFRTLYAQKLLEATNGLLDIIKRYQEMAAVRFEAGQSSSLDILRGRLEWLRAEGEIIEARRGLRESQASLLRLTGQEEGEPTPTVADRLSPPLARDLAALEREAESRPSLKAAELQLARAGAAARLARKNAWPDFVLGLYYPSLRTSGWGFSVGATIPIWRDKVKGEILEADAVSQAQAAALEARRQKIRYSIRAAYADVRAAEEQLALFEKSVLKEVDNLLEMGIAQYRYGKIDSLNLFDLYRLYRSTRLEYLGALERHELALVELEVAGESAREEE